MWFFVSGVYRLGIYFSENFVDKLNRQEIFFVKESIFFNNLKTAHGFENI